MKTNKLNLLLLSCLLCASCSNLNKQKSEIAEDAIICSKSTVAQTENLVPPPELKESITFTSPVVSEDEMLSQEELYVSNQACIVAEDKAYICAEQMPMYPGNEREQQDESYSSFVENKFKLAKDEPLSTFSADVDAASYSNVRRFVNRGALPEKDAVRIEELVNYFSYDYPQPDGTAPVRIITETGACPWNQAHRLVKIGLKAKEIPSANLPKSNFVFLIDVSGSMEGATRLGLVKSSLKLLVNNLREQDRVAIVVYAGAAGEVLPPTSGADKQKIREALENLQAGGSTAGGEGIQLAYKIAKKNFIEGGNNRIILCTDGDFNVGVSSNSGLKRLIEKERESGVFLSILGYGMGNYKDDKMQTLAQAGNGNHAYIDNLQEANKVLVNEFGSTMYAVAKDVKLQVEFNPAKVQAYRLVGYETRLLNKEDFNDDTKDAGEMGAGHTVTAFYEIIPVGVKSALLGSIDPLKYQKEVKESLKVDLSSPELLTVKLRYKQPNADISKKIEVPVIEVKKEYDSEDFRFATAVAMYGQLLRDSKYKGDATYDKVIALAKTGLSNDPQGYRREFVRLAEATKGLN
jgi:Ca-activated chloride channel family protein